MRLAILLALVVAATVAVVVIVRRDAHTEAAPLTWVAEAHQLGPVGYRDPAGALSPDGQWIAYSEGRFLRVRRAGGGPAAQLPARHAQIRNLPWNPDSQRIVPGRYLTPAAVGPADPLARTR